MFDKMMKSFSFYIYVMIFLAFMFTGCSGDRSKDYSSGKVIGKEGTAEEEFDGPIGIAIDAQGFIYVSDSGNNRIQKFSSDGKFIKAWGSGGTAKGELDRPMHMTIGPDGNLYVAEYLNDRVQVFHRDGSFVRLIGLKPDGKSYFDAPGGVAVDENGNVYVADFYHHQIQKFDAQGRFLESFGRHGFVWAGKLNYPTDVAVTSDNNLLIADAYNNRIQKMNFKGKFLKKWGGLLGFGIPWSGRGYFKVVTGIGMDSDGNIYATDFYNNRVQKLSSKGKVLTVFGNKGETTLHYPTDVVVAPDSSIWVVDFGNNRIVQFKHE